MQRTMVVISPLMIGYFALQVPAGLGLYWFVGNCVSIIQQSFVVGWGNVLPAAQGRRRRPPVTAKERAARRPGRHREQLPKRVHGRARRIRPPKARA